jgi:hypothetical protein
MPKQFRVLTPEEALKYRRRGGRVVDLTDYLNFVRGMVPGQIAEVTLSEGEKKTTIKRRLTSAAKQLGKELKYKRSSDNSIVFEVVQS